MRRLPFLVGLLLVCVSGGAGCARSEVKTREAADPAGREDRFKQVAAQDEAERGPERKPLEKDLPRRIIYTASVRHITTQFDKARKDLKQLATQYKGYIEHEEVRT